MFRFLFPQAQTSHCNYEGRAIENSDHLLGHRNGAVSARLSPVLIKKVKQIQSKDVQNDFLLWDVGRLPGAPWR